MSDRIVTKRVESRETAAFVRLRVDNHGRSTARNIVVSVLKVHRWEPVIQERIRSRLELEGRYPQPSNQLASQPDLADVFPHSDRIVDLASVDLARAGDGSNSIVREISHPRPPIEANVLEPAIWRLELLVCRDNIKPLRSFVTPAFDGTWPQPETRAIWAHFLVHGPFPELSVPPEEAIRLSGGRATSDTAAATSTGRLRE